MKHKIIYNTLELEVEGTNVYFQGKLLTPVLNKHLNRYYYHIYLGRVPPAETRVKPNAKGYAYFTVPCARIIAAGHDPNFDYDKYKELQCDHIDGRSDHDVPSNLRFTTRKRNNSRKMARARKSLNHKLSTHSDQLVKAVNIRTGETRLYKNMNECAKGLGCSHVLVVNVMNPNHYQKTAKGWRLEFVPLYHGIIN